MGCCASAPDDGLPPYVVPPLEMSNMRDYVMDDERLDDPALVARVREMVDSEPDKATHKLNLALLLARTGKRRTPAEMGELFAAARAADPQHVPTYTHWASYADSVGDTAQAAKLYDEGYNVIYRGGAGRMLTEADVTHLVHFAVFAERTNYSKPNFSVTTLYRDAALQAPDNTTAQGNYGLYLARHNDRAGALPRLQKAAAAGDAFWMEQLAAFNAASS